MTLLFNNPHCMNIFMPAMVYIGMSPIPMPVTRTTKQRLLIVVFCILGSLLIDWADCITGERYELFVFYLIPIAAATWYGGRAAGITLAIFSAAAWFQSDFLSQHHYSLTIGSWDTVMRLISFLAIAVTLSWIRTDLLQLQAMNKKLTTAMAEIKQLEGILPMCMFCRKIRGADDHWISLERYVSEHSDAQISHGMCPGCYRKHYGDPNGT